MNSLAKLHQQKQGLMYDLLTDLRPTFKTQF